MASRHPRHPRFSPLNDPIPNGEKPSWVSLKTGKIVQPDATRIPPGFHRWARKVRRTRTFVFGVLCTMGQYRFKARMQWLAGKCGIQERCLRYCIADLEKGGWIVRKETKRGGCLSGWNLFTIPHLSGSVKPPAHRRHSRAGIGKVQGR